MDHEDDEALIHHLQLLPEPGHWPGRSCYCRPVEVEVNAPCGHLVVVLVHGELTSELRRKIKDDIATRFQRHLRGEGSA